MKITLKIFAGLFILISVLMSTCFILMTFRESATPQEAAPAEGRFVQTRDASIFVREHGPETGPKILLIHGTGAWGAIWADTESVLADKGFRVLTIDIPPFGYSQKLHGSAAYSAEKQALRILDVLDQMNISSLYALCHSVGCRPMTEAVLRSPDKFKKFIQVDAALGFSKDPQNVKFLQNTPSLIQKIAMSPSVIRDALFATYGAAPWSIKPLFESFVFRKDAVTDDRVSMLKKPLALNNMTRAQGDWLQNLMINRDDSLYTDYNNYNRLEMPILIIWGEKDELTPLWQGQTLEKMYPHATLHVIPDAGHIPYLEDTDQFNDALVKFLAP